MIFDGGSLSFCFYFIFNLDLKSRKPNYLNNMTNQKQNLDAVLISY